MLSFVFFTLVIFSFIALAIGKYKYNQLIPDQSKAFTSPNGEYWFGTDNYGRDVFARIIHGGRISLTIGAVCTLVAVFCGGLLGAVAGFYGGWPDTIITRFTDAMMCIPAILMALTVVSVLGPGMVNLMMAITISQVPNFARVIRSVILTLRDQEYIRAARSCGTGDFRIIYRHIIPNALGPVIVQATMTIADMILTAAGLSFIGMGIQPPQPEWGTMLSEAKEQMRYAPYLIAFPGFSIVLCALSFNLLGDGLRDALDPRLKN